MRVGFIGLPPEGATPSSPESGVIVAFYWGPAPGNWGKGRYWVYADGRLIFLREATIPEGANDLSTGYLEQRLTPAGAERLRAAVVALGLIGEDDGTTLGQPSDGEADDVAIGTKPVPRDATTPVPGYSMAQVRDGDQLFRISRVRDLDRLIALITDPASWLPSSAWQDRKIRAYVPSQHAVCFGSWPPDGAINRSDLSASLPTAARKLFRTSEWAEQQGLFMPKPGDLRVGHDRCSEVTTDQARALVEALASGGLEQGGGQGTTVAPDLVTSDERAAAGRETTYRLSYLFDTSGPVRGHIYFEPILPHGEWTCSVCG